jgi:hypothetical protein
LKSVEPIKVGRGKRFVMFFKEIEDMTYNYALNKNI